MEAETEIGTETDRGTGADGAGAAPSRHRSLRAPDNLTSFQEGSYDSGTFCGGSQATRVMKRKQVSHGAPLPTPPLVPHSVHQGPPASLHLLCPPRPHCMSHLSPGGGSSEAQGRKVKVASSVVLHTPTNAVNTH